MRSRRDARRLERLGRGAALFRASASRRCSVETYSSLSLPPPLRRVEDLQRALGEVAALAAVDLRHLAQLVLEPLLDQARLGAHALEQGSDQAVLLLQQRGEQVLGQDLLVVALAGNAPALPAGPPAP